jgi:hypothetical protein
MFKVSPDASLAQRVGVGILGVAFLIAGLLLAYWANVAAVGQGIATALFIFLVAFVVLMVAIRLLTNLFRR